MEPWRRKVWRTWVRLGDGWPMKRTVVIVSAVWDSMPRVTRVASASSERRWLHQGQNITKDPKHKLSDTPNRHAEIRRRRAFLSARLSLFPFMRAFSRPRLFLFRLRHAFPPPRHSFFPFRRNFLAKGRNLFGKGRSLFSSRHAFLRQRLSLFSFGHAFSRQKLAFFPLRPAFSPRLQVSSSPSLPVLRFCPSVLHQPHQRFR